ncbi:hypothetical protein XENORESO_009638, partial [Xenotaenia resolanae]
MQIRSSWLWGDIHVDGEALCLCLFQEASADFVPVEDEWNERRRTQMTAIGFKGATLVSTTSKECRDSDADLDVDGDDTLEYGRAQLSEDSTPTTLDALKARIRDLEKQLSKGDRFKCLICMGHLVAAFQTKTVCFCLCLQDTYTTPLTSIQCWHVHWCKEVVSSVQHHHVTWRPETSLSVARSNSRRNFLSFSQGWRCGAAGLSYMSTFVLQKETSRTMSGPRPVVLSGPSGAGKSTLLKRLMKDHEGVFGFSVSHTTRSPRPGEEDGKDYHFTTREAMQEGINNGEFIENAEFSGNMYGTSKAAVENVRAKNLICILDVDIQGVKRIKESDLDPIYISIQPPSMEILEKRLRDRQTETEESLQKRLEAARIDMELSKEPGVFDIVIINDDLEKAYEELKKILNEEITKVQE